jgi:cation transport ATPase
MYDLLYIPSIMKIDAFCVWCFPFERAISILVASCPCALGLAVPSVVIITLNLAIQHGILVKKVIEFINYLKEFNLRADLKSKAYHV